jgi:hypothetical protein
MKGLVNLTLVFLAGCFANGPEPVPPPPVPTPDQCPAGFGPLGDLPGCYMELEMTAQWVDAEHNCEAFAANDRKAHLVVIDRIDEHTAFSMMSLQGDLWVGRLQQDPDDDYRNINYIEWDASYFGAGEPNDLGQDCDWLSCSSRSGAGDERCIEYKHETGLWNDEKCYRLDRVICEWDNVAPYAWKPE